MRGSWVFVSAVAFQPLIEPGRHFPLRKITSGTTPRLDRATLPAPFPDARQGTWQATSVALVLALALVGAQGPRPRAAAASIGAGRSAGSLSPKRSSRSARRVGRAGRARASAGELGDFRVRLAEADDIAEVAQLQVDIFLPVEEATTGPFGFLFGQRDDREARARSLAAALAERVA